VSDPCASAKSGNGPYCGQSLGGGDPKALYQCSNGATASQMTCGNGCQVNPPGTADACASAQADPCHSAANGNGSYCGQALTGGDPNALYNCQGGATASKAACAGGCQVNPPGVADACGSTTADPCAAATHGNGPYCGQVLPGGDGSALYNCQNGATAGKQGCASGCQVNPPGVPDACASGGSDPCASSGSGNGSYCGGALKGADSNALYNCQNGSTASKQGCANGCQTNPPGVPDACATSGGCCLQQPPGTFVRGFTGNCSNGSGHFGIDYGTGVGTPIPAGMSGTVVSHALGFPNCWANGGCTSQCYSSFNYIKIKSDCGDPDQPGRDYYIYYLHISQLGPGIADGAHVGQGQVIAYSGNSGCSSGPHIHFETASVPQGQAAHLDSCNTVDPSTRYCH
jgi:hypothetical protein